MPGSFWTSRHPLSASDRVGRWVRQGRTTAIAQVPSGFVDQVNRMQTLTAQAYTYHRLNADFSMRIDEWRASTAPAFTWPIVPEA